MFEKLAEDINNAVMYKLAWLAQDGIEKTADTGHMVRQLASAVKRNKQTLMSLKDMHYSKLNMPEVTDLVNKVRSKLRYNNLKSDVAANNINNMTDPDIFYNTPGLTQDDINIRNKHFQRNLDAYGLKGTKAILSKYSNDPDMFRARVDDLDFGGRFSDTVGNVLGSFF